MEEIELKKYILQTIGEDTNDIDFENAESQKTKNFNKAFELGIRNALCKYKWGFATFRKELTDKEVLENQQYKYSFALPDDFILIINAFPSMSATNNIRDFQVADRFNTNEENVVIEYIRNVPTTKFPIYFIEYLKYKIASEVCYFLTGDTELLNVLVQQAKEEFAIATNNESMSKKTSVIKTGIFAGARFRS